MFDHKNVRVELDGAVALVTLDRPPVNALDRTARYELIAVFDEISQRDDIRCAVLTGAGKSFCAGADLKDRPKSDSPGDFLAHNRAVRETGEVLHRDRGVVAEELDADVAEAGGQDCVLRGGAAHCGGLPSVSGRLGGPRGTAAPRTRRAGCEDHP